MSTADTKCKLCGNAHRLGGDHIWPDQPKKGGDAPAKFGPVSERPVAKPQTTEVLAGAIPGKDEYTVVRRSKAKQAKYMRDYRAAIKLGISVAEYRKRNA